MLPKCAINNAIFEGIDVCGVGKGVLPGTLVL
jgi:hypothetical protein